MCQMHNHGANFFFSSISLKLIFAIISKKALFHDEIGLYAKGYTSGTKCNVDVDHIDETNREYVYVCIRVYLEREK